MDRELRNKIIALFEYRELPKLIAYGGGTWDIQFYENLIQLQYDIYMLDFELETNWEVDMSIIDTRWKAIHKDLGVLGVSTSDYDRYSGHIYKYQKHELRIRDGKFPTRLSMEYFYFYKSCDVKLLRKLIYDKNPELAKVIKTSEWRTFDLVTEINDDVVDLQEDLTTINGNRFLISLIQFGKERTVQIFNDFLDEMDVRNRQLDVKSIEGVEFLDWTDTQIRETKELVVSQATCVDGLDLSLYERVLGVGV
ncbi:MAG: hypothetical protein ACJA1A_002859 [Saprospiraceae bacterium]|jgi:hypothetical protein|tara:strand:+ start:39 stop:794 length:756 start_codon:yes stop_codon:yes gene_type:complete